MKKYLLISLIALLAVVTANAQISSYSSYDNEESVVYEVEDMESYEIKDYNSWTKKDLPHESSMMYINAYRAQLNLLNAPATIIDYRIYNDKEVSNAIEIHVEIINSSPKTIKEITLEFEFENDGSPVYDIKTGDRYMVLKFANLKGRTKSDLYSDVADNILKCYHLLRNDDATYKKLFYNKKADVVRLHSAKIKYTDGSTSTKVAVFDNGYDGKHRLLDDGPLSPITKYIDYLEKKESSQNNEINKPVNTAKDTEVFHSAAHMPAYIGGDAALLSYINSHLRFPPETCAQGRVVLQFVVKKDGYIGDIKVARGLGKDMDDEAIKVIKSLNDRGYPAFSPGRNAVGDPVDVWYTLPVTFRLQGVN